MPAPPGNTRRTGVAGRGGTTTGQLALTERELPQVAHADLGLIDDDHTPDMRTPPAATRGDLNEPDTHVIKREKEF